MAAAQALRRACAPGLNVEGISPAGVVRPRRTEGPENRSREPAAFGTGSCTNCPAPATDMRAPAVAATAGARMEPR